MEAFPRAPWGRIQGFMALERFRALPRTLGILAIFAEKRPSMGVWFLVQGPSIPARSPCMTRAETRFPLAPMTHTSRISLRTTHARVQTERIAFNQRCPTLRDP